MYYYFHFDYYSRSQEHKYTGEHVNAHWDKNDEEVEEEENDRERAN